MQWKQSGDFTWTRENFVVTWNGMPASYALYKNGALERTFESPQQARAYADSLTKPNRVTFITLSESGYRDVSIVFDRGTLELEAEGESIQLSPRMLRQLADFIERELTKESES